MESDNTFTFTVPGYTITVTGTAPVAPEATVVDVTQGETLQVNETDATPVETPTAEPAPEATA